MGSWPTLHIIICEFNTGTEIGRVLRPRGLAFRILGIVIRKFASVEPGRPFESQCVRILFLILHWRLNLGMEE
jgi:hypothetical protein